MPGPARRPALAFPRFNPKPRRHGGLRRTSGVQIDLGDQFQFRMPERSPPEVVFDDGSYRPNPVLMFRMGKATERWTDSPGAALQDVRSFLADWPKGLSCIFMTSASPFAEKSVRLRQKAQDPIEAAFYNVGGLCSLVPGFTAETVPEDMVNAANFRRYG